MLNIFVSPTTPKVLPSKSYNAKSPGERAEQSAPCYYCLAPADGTRVINQLIFTVPTENGYRFKYIHLCSHCQEDAYNRLQLLPHTNRMPEPKSAPIDQQEESPKVVEVVKVEESSVPEPQQHLKPVPASNHITDKILSLVQQERIRQILEEGHSPDKDKAHVRQEIARAAATYILPETYRGKCIKGQTDFPLMFPWTRDKWSPTPGDRLRELILGLALGIAEVERLTRLNDYDLGDSEFAPPLDNKNISSEPLPASEQSIPDLTPLIRLVENQRTLFLNLCRGDSWQKQMSTTAHTEKAKAVTDWLKAQIKARQASARDAV